MKTDQPLIPTSALGTIGILLLTLNAVLFWGNDPSAFSERTLDPRWWPVPVFAIPLFLTLASFWGLRLLRPAKTFYLVLCLGLLATETLNADDNRLRMVARQSPVTDANVQETLCLSVERQHRGNWRYPYLIRCFTEMEYQYTGGRYKEENIRFRLHFPWKVEPGRKYPLIIWLHGRGDANDDNERQLTRMQSMIDLLAGKNAEDFFVMATSCPEDNRQWTRSTVSDGKGDAPITVAMEIMEAIIAEYPIDTDRISVFGISSGAGCAWEFVKRNPNRIAGMVACSGGPPSGAQTNDYLTTAVWAFANNGDPSVLYEDTQRFVNAINADAGNAWQTVYEAEGHDAWTNAMLHDKAIHWLLLQHRDRPGPPPGVVCRLLSVRNQLFMFVLPVLLIVGVGLWPRKKRRPTEEADAV